MVLICIFLITNAVGIFVCLYLCFLCCEKSVHAFCPFKNLECLFLLLGDLRNVHTRVCVLTWMTLLCTWSRHQHHHPPASWSLLRTPGARAHSWAPHTPRLGSVLLCFFLQTSNCLLHSSSGVQLPSLRLKTPPCVSLCPAPSPMQAPSGPFWSCRVLFPHHRLPVLISPLLC